MLKLGFYLAVAFVTIVFVFYDILFMEIPDEVLIPANIILFILLFAGGFVIITSAGDPEKQQQGSKALTAAIVGFVIIFVSYWIIQIVQQLTGINILEPNIPK